MARLVICLLFALIGFSATGCDWSATEHAAGGPDQPAQVKPPSHWAPHVRNWQRALRAAAVQNPTARYPTPSPALLVQRLQQGSKRYGFRVVSVRILRAPEGSPQVIIQAPKTKAFVGRVPAIVRALDPNHPVAEDWLGWAYEGFFLGAQDAKGNPFLAVFNTMRIRSGGQWARTQQLFPYAHG